MKGIITQRTEPTCHHQAFGYLDQAGREIGMVSLCWEVDVIELADPKSVYYTNFDAPGHYFAASTQATRDGKSYGALQPTQYFQADEDRAAYLERRSQDSQKAAEKKGTPRRVRFSLSLNVEM